MAERGEERRDAAKRMARSRLMSAVRAAFDAPGVEEEFERWKAAREKPASKPVLLMALLTGQMCHKAYLDGQAHGIAYGKAQAQQQAYDRGYADAVSDYEEGEAAWAR